jgi:hypothetical protein
MTTPPTDSFLDGVISGGAFATMIGGACMIGAATDRFMIVFGLVIAVVGSMVYFAHYEQMRRRR